MNEVNKLIWTGGDFGLVDKAAWDKTVAGALAAVNQDGVNLITTEPDQSAYTNEWIEKALGSRLPRAWLSTAPTPRSTSFSPRADSTTGHSERVAEQSATRSITQDAQRTTMTSADGKLAYDLDRAHVFHFWSARAPSTPS